MKDVLLIVNSDLGRGNTIGARFAHISDELERQGKSFDIIARANYTNRAVYTPWYRNSIVRVLNAIRIYVYPKLDVRAVDIRLFDRFVCRTVARMQQTYRVVHVGDTLPKVIHRLKEQGSTVMLDVPIGHPAYSQHLASRGIQVGVQTDSGASFIEPAINTVDHLIVPSTFVVETLRVAGIDKPYTIVPFGVDVSAVVQKDNAPSSTPVQCIFVGAVNMRKGIPYLLEAWKGITGAELTLCGRVYQEVREFVAAAPDTVNAVGFVDPYPYLATADIFVFPTLLEGSSKAVYEAMAYGLPVITTASAGSIVADGETGYIVPIANAAALREKVQYLIDNPEVRQRLGRTARVAVQEYTWEKYANTVIATYDL